MADALENPNPTVFCRDCGAEIREKAEICPECGVRQKGLSGGDLSDGLTDQYSTAIWIASIILAFLTFPIGLVIPGYFYLKASNGTGAEQSGLEAWTVVLLGIFGILAVELGGRKGAKILWGIVVALLALLFFLFFIALLL